MQPSTLEAFCLDSCLRFQLNPEHAAEVLEACRASRYGYTGLVALLADLSLARLLVMEDVGLTGC